MHLPVQILWRRGDATPVLCDVVYFHLAIKATSYHQLIASATVVDPAMRVVQFEYSP
jgi:hypothetical protein